MKQPKTTKEIIVFGVIGDERPDACLTACVVCNDGVTVDGATIASPLADALENFASETIFARSMEQILDHFFQENGKFITHAFLVEYRPIIDEPFAEIVSIAPLDDALLAICVSVAEKYVESRSCIWK